MFSDEAHNVEMGISNQLFPQERDETPSRLFTPTPNDNLNFTTIPSTTSSGISNPAVISDIEAFSNFIRMLAPPTPVPPPPSSETPPLPPTTTPDAPRAVTPPRRPRRRRRLRRSAASLADNPARIVRSTVRCLR